MLPVLLPIPRIAGLCYYGVWAGINLAIALIACLLGIFLLPQRTLEDLKLMAGSLLSQGILGLGLKILITGLIVVC